MTALPVTQPAPRLFGGLIDRADTEIPDWYFPSAEGVLIAGDDMLRAIGHRPGARRSSGWSRGASGFSKPARDGKTNLWVQRCGKYWIIERSIRMSDGYTQDQALVFAFVPLLVWTLTRDAAMRLAEYCDPIPCAPVAAYWADVGNVRAS